MKEIYFSICILTAVPGVTIPGIFAIKDHGGFAKEWIKNRRYLWTLAMCIISAILLGLGCYRLSERMFALYTFFSAMVMTAVFMDMMWKEVYDFVWIIALVAGAVILYTNGKLNVESIISMTVFMAAQELVMSRVYGRADCHAFCCLAVLITSLGGKLEHYTLHMLLTWISLVTVQISRRNVTKGFKLKHPVAMIPYVAFSLFGVLIAIRFSAVDFVHFS